MNYFDDFRMNMKYYREKRNISQIELSAECNCGSGTIGGIESGKAKPSFDMIIKIAEALSVTPADLFVRDSSVSKENLKEELQILFDNMLARL
ncbi:MAG: helix-turn-helix transcriptional regulator [Spirochaetaceae bacterium]|nr:helix-turn-helix transcriptional regulator [Spirochaetaceae bacterium]